MAVQPCGYCPGQHEFECYMAAQRYDRYEVYFTSHSFYINLCEGHHVAQLRLIFRVVPPRNSAPIPGFETFLSYTQKFEIVPQINEKLSGSSRRKGPYPHFASSMFVLQRVRHPNQDIAAEIIQLKQVRTLIGLIPVFGEAADRRLTKETSLEYCRQFWLDKYFDKELFYALTL